ncbi:thiosulfate:glutathione sulfurtransferase [Brachyhypopomus gauderio]|uniref:thiosulfate:glutathione sulfurtransferase n=1 Tax=Brachyhypopomus gauderio TaxID=698409 RepID=UPI004041668E
MTLFPLLRRISLAAAFKPVYYEGIAVARGLRTSAVKFSEDPSNHDSVVTYKQLKTMLASHSVQLIDVRNPDEFQAGRIPNSVNIPLGQLEESLKLSPELFEESFKVKAPKKEDNDIVLHCQRGRRSLTALGIAQRLGFIRARHYAGGYSEWAEKEKQ